ncbi:hypothetical protein A3K34_00210 [candidate division WWE3 bacterium RIFOXYC1_FULL_40_10]|uniref:Ketose-bisphosphate aldolase n=1 Tax=candidate division WWE3 bacterium RIFOXYA2_FULL_46_9 TaxID=1802636 RepID=A0A1F4W1E1_UNCKA|nr:MAG: hypothetical protein A3K58_00210 [candidate division WWE3 bacterium RIFOXYB1_FULL_40_22]OGC61316.1 MAG: hypothetical protein A3K37_00210 [candidate division WWE3 bacterium RIFOXYA1_FULL_40_11]OGC63226.1 MAG: hypothetical protein A2264_00865 [candidate division WWE3 bacterium RIFOXYA2_FULL_46_9]OGC65306.1 MAG: hypothetical protein A2326_04495 [candidate division WWE3 bacterium RIFOXYB2_FULL_41_6]OGC65699.1 MAG: hypothetical protein A3K34_00210 [candidate division WWE3 bacterium RIFOXYC1_
MSGKAYTYLQKAKAEKFAIGAFNAANLETIKAVTQAGINLKSPLFIEASPGEVAYIGVNQIVALVRSFEEDLNLPIILNLDHGTDPQMVKQAIDAGFDYVHYDAGKVEFSEAVTNARQLADYAHKAGIPIESEIDHIEGSSADHTEQASESFQDAKLYTNPEKAQKFISETGIDVFAGFFGNLHGLYKTPKHISFEVLAKLRELNPDTYFSLHGGSGIIEADVIRAISDYGIVKVNVNSEMRIAFKMTLQEVLNNTNEIAIYKVMAKPIDEVRKVVEGKIKLFGSAGKL